MEQANEYQTYKAVLADSWVLFTLDTCPQFPYFNSVPAYSRILTYQYGNSLTCLKEHVSHLAISLTLHLNTLGLYQSLEGHHVYKILSTC